MRTEVPSPKSKVQGATALAALAVLLTGCLPPPGGEVRISREREARLFHDAAEIGWRYHAGGVTLTQMHAEIDRHFPVTPLNPEPAPMLGAGNGQ